MSELSLLQPDWTVSPRVRAWVTTRVGGDSRGSHATLNLAHHVADDPHRVDSNRQRVRAALPGHPAFNWLTQVHGSRVVEAGDAGPGQTPEADALVTAVPGQALCVMTADCLPVFLADVEGGKVALAHAGWRGLAAGVVENTVAAMDLAPRRLRAWLGPAIGPCHFEVGEDVRQAFAGCMEENELRRHFQATAAGKYLADLYGLARAALARAGVDEVSGGGLCTYCDPGRFYSYRRDAETGRLLSLIYLQEA